MDSWRSLPCLVISAVMPSGVEHDSWRSSPARAVISAVMPSGVEHPSLYAVTTEALWRNVYARRLRLCRHYSGLVPKLGDYDWLPCAMLREGYGEKTCTGGGGCSDYSPVSLTYVDSANQVRLTVFRDPAA